MLFSLLVIGLLSTISQAAPIAESGPTLGLKFDKRGNSLPTLTLPDAVYQAAGYDVENDVGSAAHFTYEHSFLVLISAPRYRSTNGRIFVSLLHPWATCAGLNPLHRR